MFCTMIKPIFILFLLHAVVDSSNQRGVPVPHADILDGLITKFLNKPDYTGAVFDYLRGKQSNITDNFDMAVLDAENVKKMIENAKEKYMTRRGRNPRLAHAYYEQGRYNPHGNAIKETCLDMMKQSIYAVRYRIQDTKRFRKLFSDNITFNIGIFYGALMQVSLKLNTLYASMKKLTIWTHFLWYLVLYEKMLAANVDMHNIVERLFYLHDLYIRQMRGEKVVIAPTIPLPTGPTTRRIRYIRTTITRQTRDAAELTGLTVPPDSEEDPHSGMPDYAEPTLDERENYTAPDEFDPSHTHPQHPYDTTPETMTNETDTTPTDATDVGESTPTDASDEGESTPIDASDALTDTTDEDEATLANTESLGTEIFTEAPSDNQETQVTTDDAGGVVLRTAKPRKRDNPNYFEPTEAHIKDHRRFLMGEDDYDISDNRKKIKDVEDPEDTNFDVFASRSDEAN